MNEPAPEGTATASIGAPLASGGLAGWQRRRLEQLAGGDLRGLTAMSLAGAVRLSPFHFNRVFSHTMGVPPGRWLTRRRVERAEELLSTTTLPIGEIAREVGYQGAPQLTRAFRARHAVCPLQWRRR